MSFPPLTPCHKKPGVGGGGKYVNFTVKMEWEMGRIFVFRTFLLIWCAAVSSGYFYSSWTIYDKLTKSSKFGSRAVMHSCDSTVSACFLRKVSHRCRQIQSTFQGSWNPATCRTEPFGLSAASQGGAGEFTQGSSCIDQSYSKFR